MPTLAIRKTTFDALAPVRKRLFQLVSSQLEIGQPSLYTDGTNIWYIADDSRISLLDFAILGCFAANVTSIPTDYDFSDKSRSEIETAIQNFLSTKIVRPSSIDYSSDSAKANPYQHTLNANSAPAAIRGAASIPSGLTPVPA